MVTEVDEKKEGEPTGYLVIIARYPFYVLARRNDDARFRAAEQFKKKYGKKINKKVSLTDITFWAQAFKADERALAPLEAILRDLNGIYEKESA